MAKCGLPQRAATHAVSLRFEALESRCLLSAAPLADPAAAAIKGDGIVEYHAVICGVSDYEGTSNDLTYCDDDAKEFRDALLKGRNWELANTTLLLNSQVTESNVRSAISTMGSRADSDDVCVFFFSGHGTQVPDTEPMDEKDGYDEGLCVYSFSETITDDELGDWIGQLPTDKYVVIIDTCHSGGHIKSANARGIGDTIPEEGDGFAADFFAAATKDLDDLGHGVVLTACKDSEYSVEGAAWGNGLFTYHLLAGMDGPADANSDGAVSAEESYEYLRARVVQENSSQHPLLFDGHPGELRLVQHSGGFIVEGGESLQTSEDGATASFMLSLACEPGSAVTVSLQTSNAAEGTVSPAVLEFTTANWSIPQKITLTGVDDGAADGDVTYTLRATVTSDDPGFAGTTIPYVSVLNKDNETVVISGTVFNDYNGDGTLGFGEAPLAGRTVFIDANGNGVYDPDSDPAKQTSSRGKYAFERLSPGDYTVMSLPPEGWIATTPLGGSHVLSMETDERAEESHFGFSAPSVIVTLPADAAETSGSVSGTVSIPFPAEGNLLVVMSSDNAPEASVAAAVTILEGQTSADFTLTVHDDAVLDGDQPVSIAAAAAGFRLGSSVIIILDDESLDAPVLDAEPSETPGTTNVVSWAAVPGATGYLVQCAADGNFETIVAESGWITGTSWEFTGLEPGTTYSYRVKSRTDFEPSLGAWMQTDQADFDVNYLDKTVTTAAGSVQLAVGPKILVGEDFEDGDFSGWEFGNQGVRLITQNDGADETSRAFELRGGGEGDFYSYRNRLSVRKIPTAASFYVRSGSTETSDGYVALVDAENGPQAGDALLWFFCDPNGRFYVNNQNFNSFTYEADRWYHVELAINWAGQKFDFYVDSELVHEDVPFRGENLAQVSYIELNNFSAGSVAAWDEIAFAGAGTAYVAGGSVISTPIAPAVFQQWGTADFGASTNAQTNLTVDVLDKTGTVLAEGVAPGTELAGLVGDADTLLLRANLATNSGTMTPRLDEWTVTWQRTEPFVESDWSAVESSLQSIRELSVALSADSAWEGAAGMEAVVSVPHAFPYNITVTLAAPAEVGLPAQATILSGNTEAVVPFNLADNGAKDGGRQTVIAVSATDFSGGDVSLEISDDEVDTVVFAPISSPQTEDVPFGIAITVYNVDGLVVVPFDESVSLAAPGAAVTPDAVQFAQGTWSGSVSVDAAAASLVLQATTLSGAVGSSNAFEVQGSGAAIAGDLNGDGIVGASDLDIIRSRWAQSVPPGNWAMGDPSGDGLVGGADLDIVRANWGSTAAASAAPLSAAAKGSSENTFGPRRAGNAESLAQAAWAAEVAARQTTRTARREVGPRLADWVFANEWK